MPVLAILDVLRRSFATFAAATALLFFGGQVPAQATDGASGMRVALVIGNGAYGELGTLPNPPNDASDVAAALEKLDFQVTRVIDGDVEAMRRALRDFGRSATGADVALFYYAGHGLALKGDNYLVPVRAHLENELDLRYETLGLTDVRDALDFTDAKLKMVILDACRDNPLAKMLQRKDAQLGRSFQMSDGLAPMDVQQASGMFIAYATAPGSVALDGSNQRNSPFTKALLSHISMENTDVRVMFGSVRADVVNATGGHQTPWTEEAMLGAFEFNPVAIAPAPPTPPADYLAWGSIAATEDPADLEAFLGQFPSSDLARAARDRLTILRDPATETAAWTAIQNSRDVAAFERFLHRYPNGVFSSTALVMLQSLLGGQLFASHDVAGMEAYVARFPDAPLTPIIRSTMEQQQAANAATPPPPVAAATPEPTPPSAASPRRPADMEVAMAEPGAPAPIPQPSNPAGNSTERALTLVEPGNSPGASGLPLIGLPPEADLSPVAAMRLQTELPPYLVQIALKALGYYDGALDGKFGGASRRSAAAFQEAIGAPATGDLRPAELVTLIAEAAKRGDPNSQNTFGGMFETGAGVVRDPTAAARWYRLAADADNGYGQMNLALLYMHGTGVERDSTQARRWFKAAKANGVDGAQQHLNELQ